MNCFVIYMCFKVFNYINLFSMYSLVYQNIKIQFMVIAYVKILNIEKFH